MSENTQQIQDTNGVVEVSLIPGLIALHASEIELDNDLFLDLLKNSLSLNLAEKKRVIDAIPTLSQFQFDELVKVFQDEREKFKELAWEHPEDIKKLYQKQVTEWDELEKMYQKEQEAKAELESLKQDDSEEEQKLEDIRNSLGL